MSGEHPRPHQQPGSPGAAGLLEGVNALLRYRIQPHRQETRVGPGGPGGLWWSWWSLVVLVVLVVLLVLVVLVVLMVSGGPDGPDGL